MSFQYRKVIFNLLRRFSGVGNIEGLCVDNVKIVSMDSSIDWNSIYKSQVPLVIRGIAMSWPAYSDQQRRWTISRFRQVYGHICFPIESYGTYMDKKMQIINTKFNDYLDLIENNTPGHFYLAQLDLTDFDGLTEDIIIPAICNTGKGDLYRTNIWLSPPETDSPCHYDPFQNILCQVIGKKEIYLFAPDQSSSLYPALGTLQKNTSLINFKRDFETDRFPMIRNARGMKAVLEAGDGLFLPYKYWHYCISKSVSCSVNFWWL